MVHERLWSVGEWSVGRAPGPDRRFAVDHERLSPISRVLLAGNKKATPWSLQRRQHYATARSSLSAPQDDAEVDDDVIVDDEADETESVEQREMRWIAPPPCSEDGVDLPVTGVLMRRNRSSASSGCTDLPPQCNV